MSFLSGTSPRTGVLRFCVNALAAVGCLAIVAMALVTVADVVGRQFGLPVPGAYDIVRLLGAVAIFCALPLTKAVKGHIAIEYFFQLLARPGRALVDSLIRLLLAALFVFLAVELVRQGVIFRLGGECTPTLRLPVFWVFFVAAVGFAVSAGVTVWHLFHPGRSMMKPKQ